MKFFLIMNIEELVEALQIGNPKNQLLNSILILNEIMISLTLKLLKSSGVILSSISLGTFACLPIPYENGNINQNLLFFVVIVVAAIEKKYNNEFNSFHIVWKDNNNKIHKGSFNSYTVTLKQAIQKIIEKLQTHEQFLYGKDGLLTLKCTFKKCNPYIPSDISDDALLHDIYKHFPHYPIIQTKPSSSYKNLLHEIKQIKKQLHFNKYNVEDLVLDENVLIIMRQVKELYHSDIHKHGISSSIARNLLCIIHHEWQYLDMFLLTAIKKYSFHERKEESRTNLYCRLKEVRLQNIKKDIKEGYFISHFFASDDLQTEQIYRTDHDTFEKKVAKGFNGWKAKVDSEDENTQMILLTWIMYGAFIQQSLQISAMWNNSIDLNLIYIALEGLHGDIEKAVGLLVKFEKWKTQDNGEAKYTQKMEEFQIRRCCNNHVNLLYMFLQEKELLQKDCKDISALFTVSNGLPFVEKDCAPDNNKTH
ncbi:hypothetical protein RFI_01657 [Reticulomyxa filosa]|uniref:Uncharacterized protein n=1 Tax=Reticulomyxa filosa TaxID=46433 RepID=X6PBI1_RETFI|nr:hypothetical protein RFI_01657 [Reticulomyxa filosa]|eukprot:ETO35404.1 hypothetical protein RFI_01657 [Reticulomyxa filosa]